jgi:hypothetical protein
MGVSVDAFGAAFVAHCGGNRVRRVFPAGLASTLVGSGAARGADGVGTAARLDGPSDVALEPTGVAAFIVEQRGCRVRRVALATGRCGPAGGRGRAWRLYGWRVLRGALQRPL